MSASIVLGRDLDIFPPDIPVHGFILDANIREVNLVVEVGQVVFTRPFLNLLDGPIRPAVAVAIASITLLEEALILTFQFPIELHAQDPRLTVLQPFCGFQVRAVELRVVGSLTGLVGTRIERLAAI